MLFLLWGSRNPFQEAGFRAAFKKVGNWREDVNFSSLFLHDKSGVNYRSDGPDVCVKRDVNLDKVVRRIMMPKLPERHLRSWKRKANMGKIAALVRLRSQVVRGCMIAALLLANGRAQETPDRGEIEKKVAAIVADWESLPSVFDDIDVYTAQIKELSEIGAPAVLALAAALEKTSSDAALRLIPFTLRAIGDARAVPALIRAFPKTLRPSGSDCGMTVGDRDLLRFMQTHDIEGVEGRERSRNDFGLGRPVREVAVALRKLTGTEHNEAEVFSTFLSGGEPQRALQRKAFWQVARNWADWWNSNSSRLVQDAAFAEVNLRALPRSPDRLSTGPIKVADGMSLSILSPLESGRDCALGLGLSRRVEVPKAILENANDRVKVGAWAAEAGADLAGAVFRDPESGKDFYCLRGFDLQAWEVGNENWDKAEAMIERGGYRVKEALAGEFLMHYDAGERRYRPEKKATFVFMTRDGLEGMLRVTAQVTDTNMAGLIGMPLVVRDESGPDQRITRGFTKGVQFDYKFFYVETEEIRLAEIARREERSAREETRRKRQMAKLTAAHPPLEGILYLPGGEVAAGASVLLAGPGEGAILGDRKFEHTGRSTVVQTSEEGKFTIPHVPRARAWVVNEEGIAEIKMDEAKSPISVRLAPWGRIEGKLIRQGKTLAREKVSILNPVREDRGGLSLSLDFFRAETDSEGRFAFENLPPGEAQICRLIGNRYYEGVFVDVAAGKTTAFQHRFDGVTVKGRLVAPNAETTWKSGRAFNFYRKADATQSAGKKPVSNFPVVLAENGEFSVESVPPGVYEFRGELREGESDEVFPVGKVIGRFKREIVVPEVASVEDGTLALGRIIVE